MVAVYNRKSGFANVRHVQGSALAAWRAEVRRACVEAMEQAGMARAIGPVIVSIVFYLPRPVTHYGMMGGRRYIKDRYTDAVPGAPDLDKLTRAVFDALTGVAYEDDRQVWQVFAQRAYGPQMGASVKLSDAQIGSMNL